MILGIKKIYTCANSLESVMRFFKDTIGADYYDGQNHQPVNSDGLHIILQQHNQAGSNGEVTIVTEDCISDYCVLKEMGISFIKSPDYVSSGLAARFVDEAGNIYSLLEERNYQDMLFI